MSEKETFVAVPVSDLHKLEEARVKLWDMTEQYKISAEDIMDVTQPMWKLANTSWPIVTGDSK